VEAEDHLMTAGRQIDGAEHVMRRHDLDSLAIDIGSPTRINDLTEHQLSRPGCAQDDAVGRPFDDAYFGPGRVRIRRILDPGARPHGRVAIHVDPIDFLLQHQIISLQFECGGNP